MAHFGQFNLGVKAIPGMVGVVLGDTIISLDPASAREIGEKFIAAADEATEGLIQEMPQG